MVEHLLGCTRLSIHNQCRKKNSKTNYMTKNFWLGTLKTQRGLRQIQLTLTKLELLSHEKNDELNIAI